MTIVVLVGAGFVAIGLGALLLAARMRAGYRRWMTEGLPAMAMITGLRSDHTANLQVVWAPMLRFSLPDGRTIETEAEDATSPPAGQVGQWVEIRYDPREPSRAVPVGGNIQLVRTGLGVLSVVLGTGAVLFGLLLVAAGLLLHSLGIPW